ncbi:MAG: LacI family DNA-binding transcriptional regulator [Sphaerochaetaceae bacterium]|nr:LacI family DNA-binding transcriptional regulator [Sphaerochaetaceae bacterium]
MVKSANSMKEVAQKAGVSVSTVSRVLAGKTYISENTRELVENAAKELNYRPNVMAKGLKLGRSNAIALMIPSIDNLMFPDIVRGVEDVARSHNFVVTLCNTDEDMNKEKLYMKKLSNMGVDGIVVATMRKNSDHVRSLHEEGFPIVLTSRNYDGKLDAVVIDNFQAAYKGVSYLISRGYKNIVIALGDEELPLYHQRLLGYKKALEDAGISFREELVMREMGSNESFYPLTKDLLKKNPEIDCFFATNDIRAIIIIRALRDVGLKVPDDIGVMGFDDTQISSFVDPPLTTIHQPLYKIGANAAKRLISQIQRKQEKGDLDSPKIEVLKTILIVRESTK